MREGSQNLTDTTLSAAEATRVLERAAQIDANLQNQSVSELAAAAREAGISEHAVLQAVQELLDNRQMSTADPGSSVSSERVSRTNPWLVGVTSGLALLVALIVVFFLLRIFVSR
jgi:hypothetical protein